MRGETGIKMQAASGAVALRTTNKMAGVRANRLAVSMMPSMHIK